MAVWSRSTSGCGVSMPSATASVATSIESAPARDVRETNVEIGAVVARVNTCHASRSQLSMATSLTRSAVPDDAQTLLGAASS
jgi:hypothetical protein